MNLLRMFGSSGSALPGLMIEKLYPQFLTTTLQPVEKKVILITGTNGKTTTTKMLVSALRADDEVVVTNNSGSNMTRGLIAALIEHMTYSGTLKPSDWFVFEVDEAYAPVLARTVSPRIILALNVLRDQLDRYGEINTTANFIQQAAQKSEMFIYNSTDPVLFRVAQHLKKKGVTVFSFGTSERLAKELSDEQSLYGGERTSITKQTDVVLLTTKEENNTQLSKIRYQDFTHEVLVPMRGLHNAINATAAVAVLGQIITSKNGLQKSLTSISHMEAPFGRGEQSIIDGKIITVALVKNPSGLISTLETYVKKSSPELVVFVINDRLADGRDVSWLWDVNFKDTIPRNAVLFCGGTRGYDMAVRLKHDGFSSTVQLSVKEIVKNAMEGSYTNVVIIPTYTALFEVRDQMKKYGKVSRIW